MKKLIREEIFAKIKDILIERECIPEEEIMPDAFLMKDLEMDSLDMVQMMMYIEKEFMVSIPDNKVYELGKGTVNDLVSYIENTISTL